MEEQQYVDGWQQIHPQNFIEQTTDIISESKEQLRVLNIFYELFEETVTNNKTGKPTAIGWYFSENGTSDEVEIELEQMKWHTIYDSCNMPILDCESGYNIIQVAFPKNGYYYLAVSLNGSWGASALTEYVKVPYPPFEGGSQ